MDNLDIQLLCVENEALFTYNFTSVVSTFLKTCVKDHGDSSTPRKKDLISMYRSTLVSGFQSSLTNQRIIFKQLDRCFKKKIKILEINLPFI